MAMFVGPTKGDLYAQRQQRFSQATRALAENRQRAALLKEQKRQFDVLKMQETLHTIAQNQYDGDWAKLFKDKHMDDMTTQYLTSLFDGDVSTARLVKDGLANMNQTAEQIHKQKSEQLVKDIYELQEMEQRLQQIDQQLENEFMGPTMGTTRDAIKGAFQQVSQAAPQPQPQPQAPPRPDPITVMTQERESLGRVDWKEWNKEFYGPTELKEAAQELQDTGTIQNQRIRTALQKYGLPESGRGLEALARHRLDATSDLPFDYDLSQLKGQPYDFLKPLVENEPPLDEQIAPTRPQAPGPAPMQGPQGPTPGQVPLTRERVPFPQQLQPTGPQPAEQPDVLGRSYDGTVQRFRVPETLQFTLGKPQTEAYERATEDPTSLSAKDKRLVENANAKLNKLAKAPRNGMSPEQHSKKALLNTKEALRKSVDERKDEINSLLETVAAFYPGQTMQEKVQAFFTSTLPKDELEATQLVNAMEQFYAGLGLEERVTEVRELAQQLEQYIAEEGTWYQRALIALQRDQFAWEQDQMELADELTKGLDKPGLELFKNDLDLVKKYYDSLEQIRRDDNLSEAEKTREIMKLQDKSNPIYEAFIRNADRFGPSVGMTPEQYRQHIEEIFTKEVEEPDKFFGWLFSKVAPRLTYEIMDKFVARKLSETTQQPTRGGGARQFEPTPEDVPQPGQESTPEVDQAYDRVFGP